MGYLLIMKSYLPFFYLVCDHYNEVDILRTASLQHEHEVEHTPRIECWKISSCRGIWKMTYSHNNTRGVDTIPINDDGKGRTKPFLALLWTFISFFFFLFRAFKRLLGLVSPKYFCDLNITGRACRRLGWMETEQNGE